MKINKLLGIRLALANKGEFSRKVKMIAKDYEEKAVDVFKKYYEKKFGTGVEVVKGKAVPSNRSSKRYSKDLKSFENNIKRILEDYWSNRYREISNIASSTSSNYKKTSHYKYKRANIGSSSRGRVGTIKYTQPALMTGFLKMSIYEAISKNGNQFLDLKLNPLSVSYDFKPDNYKDGINSSQSYVRLFWSVVKGDNPEEIFKLGDPYWRRIESELEDLVNKQMVPELESIFGSRK